ncbi:MAG: MBL fold metallo-hydrolase [Deltaproteobacteria bacterium]|nr:MBL fold metallo-hydrolase [Deltaproteobacteria bacterium]
MKSASLLLALGLTLSSASNAQDFSQVEIKTIPVAEGLHMLMGRGGNIAVLAGDDGVFLVDDQYAPLTEKILAAVHAIDEGPVRFLLNTHWHGDHTGGNENLGKVGVVIVAHENVRERMSVKQVIQARGIEVPASPPAALPILTFPTSITFHLNGVTTEAVHVAPAHTDGDSVVWFAERNVVHTGDTFFNGFYPFIDVGSGGSIDGVISAVDDVLARADDETKIIPGHGPLSNREELQTYREMLVTVRDRVRAALVAGKGADEILADKPTADLDAAWGGGFLKPEDFVRIVVSDLSR